MADDASEQALARELEEAKQRAAAAEEKLAEAEQARDRSEAVLTQVRAEIDSATRPQGAGGRLRSAIANPWLVLAGIGGAILFFLYALFTQNSEDGSLLWDLKDPAFARGLITFVFSIGTLGIGIILTIAALVPGEDAAKSFTRGKEIFTILVGILGTIVGFYFGTGGADDDDLSPTPNQPVIEAPAGGLAPGDGATTPAENADT